MSLQSLIHERADVRQGFAARLKRPAIRLERALQAPPLTTNYQIVESAFDYLLRFYLHRINPQARVSSWEAERGVELIKLGSGAGKEVPTISGHSRGLKAAAYLSDAKRQYRAYLQSGQITGNLLIAAHRLAHLDVASGAGPDRVDWRSINYLSADDAADLKALLQLPDEKTFRTTRACLVRPRLRAAELVGSADPELILDDCLVSVLTAKDPRVDLKDYYELVAGYLLLGLAGVSHEDGKVEQCAVTSVGIYFSRFGYLWKTRVADIVPAGELAALTRWFVEAACMSNKGGIEMLRAFRGPLAMELFEADGTLIPAERK